MSAQDEPWGDDLELVALERMFEIALAALRSRGLAAESAARNLACRSVSTEREFTT